MRGLRDSSHGGTGIGCHNIASLRYVHGDIESSRVWVHGMVIHHS